MALANTLTVTPSDAQFCNPPLPVWRAYIIDFGASRQLAAGPGSQGPIHLPDSQYPKPLGMTSMDPYAWDMYCTGKLCEQLFTVSAYRAPGSTCSSSSSRKHISSAPNLGRELLNGLHNGSLETSADVLAYVAAGPRPVAQGGSLQSFVGLLGCGGVSWASRVGQDARSRAANPTRVPSCL